MWESIKWEVINDLKNIRQITGLNTLLITGISMGGGLSVISFIDINKAQVFNTVKITTFGAPRVGNKHWAEHFDMITGRRSRRFYIKGDPIVVMPRCLTLLCTYRQTGVGIVCTEDNQMCFQETELPELTMLRDENVGSLIDHM